MKFAIYDNIPVEGAVLHKAPQYTSSELWIKEINSLEELLELADKIGDDLIVGKMFDPVKYYFDKDIEGYIKRNTEE